MKLCWLQEKCGAFGGAEANVLWTARALRARGFENHLICAERTGIDEERWQEAFHQIEVLSSPLSDALHRIAPDAVWIHNWTRCMDFSAPQESDIPSARMVHDHAMYCMRHYKYHPVTRKNCGRPASLACVFPCLAFLRRRGGGGFPFDYVSYPAKQREIASNRLLDRLVVASEFMRGELVKNRFDPAKIHILPPVPPEPPAGSGESPAGSGESPAGSGESPAGSGVIAGRILYVGQVIRGKGVDLLVRALHGLAGDWHFELAGGGGALSGVRRLIDGLGLGARVSFHGHLSPGELATLYRSAQIVVVPSAWQEPFGMVGIEAMRMSRPVVAFANGGIPDWLEDGENGLLVAPNDVDALRVALGRLLADPVFCDAMGARGRRIASGRFSFANYIGRLESFLVDLAACRT